MSTVIFVWLLIQVPLGMVTGRLLRAPAVVTTRPLPARLDPRAALPSRETLTGAAVVVLVVAVSVAVNVAMRGDVVTWHGLTEVQS